MPYFDAPDAAIFYETLGDGPPLILLHGYALNSLMWKFQIETLSRGHRLYLVDLRGFGKSSCGARWSGAVMAEDVTGIIEKENLSGVIVVGFSMGGPVAIRVAYDLARIVSRLILVSSGLPSAVRPKARSEEKLQEKELEALQLHGIKGWIEIIGLKTGPLVEGMFDKNPAIAPLWDEIINRHDPHFLQSMMIARAAAMTTVDWRSRLKDIRQQTLVIAGADDLRFLDSARRLASDIPNARLEIITGAGHMVNLERAEQFNHLILEFLTR